jgi:capsular polysaccharide biosynthesis protein
MNDEPLDLSRFRRAVERGKWVVVAFAVGGMIAGGVLSLVRVRHYSATSVVLLPPAGLDASGASDRDVQTEVQIASSADVLALAGGKLTPKRSVDQLRHRLTVSAPTDGILRFKSKTTSAGEAIAIANATAEAYRDYSANSGSTTDSKIADALQARVTELNRQLDHVRSQTTDAISQLAKATNASDASTIGALISSLRAQESELTSQLNDTLSQLSQTNRSEPRRARARLISPATRASNSAARGLALNLSVGALMGLLLGLTVVLARESRDRRLRRGADIAAAAGVPTIASMRTQCPDLPSEWLTLLENYEANAEERWSLRRLLRTIVPAEMSHPAHLGIVTLPWDSATAPVAPQLAAFAAGSGIGTVLLVDGSEPPLAALRQARDVINLSAVELRPNLSIVPHLPADEGPRAQLVVSMILADETVLDCDPQPSLTTLLAVSSGAATSEQLARVAATAASAGCPLAGIIVANPEPDDASGGAIPNGWRALTAHAPRGLGRTRQGSAS